MMGLLRDTNASLIERVNDLQELYTNGFNATADDINENNNNFMEVVKIVNGLKEVVTNQGLAIIEIRSFLGQLVDQGNDVVIAEEDVKGLLKKLDSIGASKNV